MARLATCNNCGTVSLAGAFASGPTDVPQCPVCGGSVHVLNAYAFVSLTLGVLLQPGHTMGDLRNYEEAVRNLQRDLDNNEVSAEEAPERLCREAPELATLADVLPRTRSDLYAFLSLILAAISLWVSIRGDDAEEVDIRVDEVNIYRDRVIDRYVAQVNEPSLLTTPRSRRDAVKALVTAYAILRQVRDEMEEVLPLATEHPAFALDRENPTIIRDSKGRELYRVLSNRDITPQLRKAQRRLRQLAEQVQRVSDRLGQPPYEWLPEATGDKARLCIQRFMNFTQLYGYPDRDVRGPWVPLPEEIPTLPPPLFRRLPPLHYTYAAWSVDPVEYLDRALDLLRQAIESIPSSY